MSLSHFPRSATGLLTLLALVCMLEPAARAEVIDLVVRPGTTTADGEATVVLEARQPAGLGALEVEIVYDADALEARSVSKEALLADGMLEYDLRPGRVRCVMINGEPISADGSVLTVLFQSKRSSGSTTISLENIKAWDFERGLEMRVSATAGDLNLQPAPASQEPASNAPRSWLVFAVPAGIIVLAVLMLWVYQQGRRHGQST
jgi:hypothetical protein